MGAIKRGFVQFKGGQFVLQGPRLPLQDHRFPFQALGSPSGALFSCLVVCHSPQGLIA